LLRRLLAATPASVRARYLPATRNEPSFARQAGRGACFACASDRHRRDRSDCRSGRPAGAQVETAGPRGSGQSSERCSTRGPLLPRTKRSTRANPKHESRLALAFDDGSTLRVALDGSSFAGAGVRAAAHPALPAIRATTHVEGKAIRSSRRARRGLGCGLRTTMAPPAGRRY
jgi:hypothetical protein